MRKITMVLAVVMAVIPAVATSADEPAKGGPIDVVFCIDRSGSMSAVIETAKQKVWAIVNDIAVRVEPRPVLRIGLIGYGSGDGDIKFFQLSDDLDTVYKNLMTFKTDMGGDEWVGWALMKAHKEMKWNGDAKALKIVFMVGNETAKQGRAEVLYDKTAPEAIKSGIMVNAIYCGNPSAEEEQTWREVARLADGTYSAIDLSGGAVTIQTPFDKELNDLNGKINSTYIPYGASGDERKRLQDEQDANSEAHGGAANAAQRAVQKSGGLYHNDMWDLVDASKNKDFKLEDLKDDDLPKEMRGMTVDQRRAFVAEKQKERDTIQKSVMELHEKQRKFIDDEMKKQNLTAEGAFDVAVRKSLLDQAEKKGFNVKK